MQDVDDTISSIPEISPQGNRRLLTWNRALTLLPWITIIAELIADPLGRALPGANGPVSLLGNLAWILYLLNGYSVFKSNPHLRKALISYIPWTPKQFRRWDVGLDEREKLVVAQAYRLSYKIITLIFTAVVVSVFINMNWLHLPFTLGRVETIDILVAGLFILAYLPLTMAVWKEGI